MKNKKIAVVGAGIMGSDLSLDLASYGYQVLLKDVNDSALEKARQKMAHTFRFMKLMRAESLTVSLEELLSRVRFLTKYQDFEMADFVVENITEDYELKKEVYLELQKICGEHTIYGVNTSCISITKIGALMPHPENVIGMHFLNPVPLKNLVEVIRGFHTSDDTLDRTKAFLKGIGKTWVVVNDMPGFVTNRVLMLMINECIYLVQEKVAKAEGIDKIFKTGFGHKMGPLATADLIGLDTILNSLEVLFESYKDPKFRPCPLLKKMVSGGLLGQKSGKGFFTYIKQ
jgi:3-hydroxybutyryl-CoA dehydrogenase